MTTLGSSTTVDFIGVWLVEGSSGSSWISNNSPNSLELSGLTQGLNYLKFPKLLSDNLKEASIFTSWHIGTGVKNFFTYGDDEGNRVVSAKLTGTRANQNIEKAYIKRFKKRHNRGSAANVYLFHRFDTSANAFETFYNPSQTSKKYVPILLRNINYMWQQQTNLKTTANLTVEEVWE